jgi:N-methylhydantoinase A
MNIPAKPNGKTIRVATDVGGTFTDLVYFETDSTTGRQIVRTAKVDTTPPNYEKGVLDVLDKAGVSAAEVSFFAHGTTVVINALTERKGVVTALITTEGFRDVLEIARGNRPDFFNLLYEKPAAFVPRFLRRELPGRVQYTGKELAPLDLSGLPAILADFQREGVEAIAICLLHSYANPSHEEAVVAEIKRLWPEVSVVASHQITREWREYERTSTAVLSAYVQPIAGRYLERLQAGLAGRNFGGQLYVMQSNCGVDSMSATRQIPITMVESGPASGFWGAAELGRIINRPNVLALDIGGTTAKCSLIENGHVKIMTDYWIGRSRKTSGYPIMVPVVDLVEIGNGGGSIAWVDDFGKLHVGPRSAGAMPGPASYGRGGTEATTTDANLALGRIDKDYFCGGTISADMKAVDTALGRIADRLGVDHIEAARGIVRIANSNMINALKLVSLNRGYDPRDFTLVAFGGGGGMHAVALASELGIRNVVVPRGASVFSAWGMMMSDLRRDYFVTKLISSGKGSTEALSATVEETKARARQQFADEGVKSEDVRIVVFVKCRYQNQEHAVEVDLASDTVNPETMRAMLERFHAVYEREYTYRLDAPVEIVGIHLIASAEVGKLEILEMPKTGATLDAARKRVREVDYALEGVHEADVYDADRLEPDMAFSGPAVIEDPGTTIVIHPGNRVTVDPFGNIHIEI